MSSLDGIEEAMGGIQTRYRGSWRRLLSIAARQPASPLRHKTSCIEEFVCPPGGPEVVKWNVACGARRVDQWAQLLRDSLELGRVQMRDNGAEVGGLSDVGPSNVFPTTPLGGLHCPPCLRWHELAAKQKMSLVTKRSRGQWLR
jgi:hypothetical protein